MIFFFFFHFFDFFFFFPFLFSTLSGDEVEKRIIGERNRGFGEVHFHEHDKEDEVLISYFLIFLFPSFLIPYFHVNFLFLIFSFSRIQLFYPSKTFLSSEQGHFWPVSLKSTLFVK